VLAPSFHGHARNDRATTPIDEEGDAHSPKLRDLIRLAAESGQSF